MVLCDNLCRKAIVRRRTAYSIQVYLSVFILHSISVAVRSPKLSGALRVARQLNPSSTTERKFEACGRLGNLIARSGTSGCSDNRCIDVKRLRNTNLRICYDLHERASARTSIYSPPTASNVSACQVTTDTINNQQRSELDTVRYSHHTTYLCFGHPHSPRLAERERKRDLTNRNRIIDIDDLWSWRESDGVQCHFGTG